MIQKNPTTYRAWFGRVAVVGLFVLSLLASLSWRGDSRDDSRTHRDPMADGLAAEQAPAPRQLREELAPPIADQFHATDVEADVDAGDETAANADAVLVAEAAPVREADAPTSDASTDDASTDDDSTDDNEAPADGDTNEDGPLLQFDLPPSSPTPIEPSAEDPPSETPSLELPSSESPAPEPSSAHTPANNENSNATTTERTAWPWPARLVADLERICGNPICAEWSQAVISELKQLHGTPDLASEESRTRVGRIAKLHSAGRTAARRLDVGEQEQMTRALYSLQRRVDVWRAIQELLQTGEASAPSRSSGDVARQLQLALREVSSLENSQTWREYLRFDVAIPLFEYFATNESQRQDMARMLLIRIDSPSMTLKQQQYFQQPVFVALRKMLYPWASEDVNYSSLLHTLENYEQHQELHYAKVVASNLHLLEWSQEPAKKQIRRAIETHYANANVRVAISQVLMNRFLPKQHTSSQPVSEVISGAQVRGTSQTKSEVSLRLVPHAQRLQGRLQSRGTILSNTEASAGPARFRNTGRARYLAEKPFILDQHGLRVGRTRARAKNQTQVHDVTTDYDGVPLIDSIARSIAMQEQQQKEAQSNREAAQRIEQTVQRQLDARVEEQLRDAEEKFFEKIIQPLRAFRLNPTAIGYETTPDRFISRMRLAGHAQLAAHTPRPRAIAESLASAQFHQSTINNLVAKLALDGKTYKLRKLYAELSGRFGAKQGEVPEEIPEDVQVRMADHGSARFDFGDGRVRITLKLAELAAGGRRPWRDLTVQVDYVAQTDGLMVTFARDPEGFVSLAGRRLRLRDQIALRGIFSKVFSLKRSYPITPKKLMEDERYQDLEIAQLAIIDGWIGVSLVDKTSVNPQVRARVADSPSATTSTR